MFKLSFIYLKSIYLNFNLIKIKLKPPFTLFYGFNDAKTILITARLMCIPDARLQAPAFIRSSLRMIKLHNIDLTLK
ncbi:hypothetical protein CS542_06760 [Pedobacter sp. IW39]|nr:hypothetical protein CS542_06760 [Pedobacter sp. IW39]